MTYRVKSYEETERVAREFAARLEEKNSSRIFIAMRGEMGVGKTVFTRGFASHFGINAVKSPTYTVLNEYRGRVNIFHFDLYRITDSDDLYSIGYEDYLKKDGIAIVEWSERVPEEIPEGAIFVTISRTDGDENERIIEISTEE